MPKGNSYIVYGYVYGLDGALIIENATITFTNDSETISVTTNSFGKYIADFYNFDSGISNGDVVTIVAIKDGVGTKSDTITVNLAQGGEQKDMTLEEFSDDIDYESATRYQLLKALLAHRDGTAISEDLPLPIFNSFNPEKQNVKVEFGYNSSDELIWIYKTINGTKYKRPVTDDDYTGGTGEGDVDRTITFDTWSR